MENNTNLIASELFAGMARERLALAMSYAKEGNALAPIKFGGYAAELLAKAFEYDRAAA